MPRRPDIVRDRRTRPSATLRHPRRAALRPLAQPPPRCAPLTDTARASPWIQARSAARLPKPRRIRQRISFEVCSAPGSAFPADARPLRGASPIPATPRPGIPDPHRTGVHPASRIRAQVPPAPRPEHPQKTVQPADLWADRLTKVSTLRSAGVRPPSSRAARPRPWPWSPCRGSSIRYAGRSAPPAPGRRPPAPPRPPCRRPY